MQTLTRLLSLLSLLALVATSASAAPSPSGIDVEAIRKAVGSPRGAATFKVSENWLTRLPREQLKRMMGVNDPSLFDDATFEAQNARQSRAELAVDWRNKDGVNWVSPMLNQGNCGSCVAFASVATLETQLNITSGIPGLNPSFSKQALFTCGGGACEFGWQPHLAARHLQNKGVPDEACAPYTMGATGETVSCNTACSDMAARSYKIARFSTPSKGVKDIEAVKKALADGPLMTAMMVYEDFVTYSGGIYKHVTGTTVGGHAISIVGFDDASRTWIIRNSWGTEWGENGFARISWEDVSGISNSTWAFQLSPPAGLVFIKNLENRAFIAGDFKIQAESTFPSTADVSIKVLNASGKTIWNSGCVPTAEGSCEALLNTTQLADGRYEAIATAKWGQGNATDSHHEIFYVVNGTPTLNLSFTPASGVNLGKPLSDRVVFDIQANTSPVPFSSLEFQVRSGGKIVYAKAADVVVAKMTMGWRTISVPDGDYEISFLGRLSVPGKADFTTETQRVAVKVKNGKAAL